MFSRKKLSPEQAELRHITDVDPAEATQDALACEFPGAVILPGASGNLYVPGFDGASFRKTVDRLLAKEVEAADAPKTAD